MAPSNAFYKTLAWSVDSTTNMKSSISGARITLTPTEKSKAGVAKVTATATDDYGRTYSRTINVVLADKTASNITISDTSLTRYATDSNYTVTATATSTSGTPDVGTIEWFSSDESVATVNGGVIDFIDKGTCTITAKTVDGGYSKNVAVTVYTNFLSTCLSRRPAATPTLFPKKQSRRICWWYPATASAVPAISGSATASAMI